MMGNYPVVATLPCADLERAKAWYREKLGMEPEHEDAGGAYYDCAEGTRFALFPTPNAGTAQNTQMEWRVPDLPAVVDELRGRGVSFERYDIPGIEWDGDIATFAGYRGCWFKDSEGNTLGIGEIKT